MKELIPGEPNSQYAGPSHSRLLVADDDETDRHLTIWQLGRAWPFEREMMVECAGDDAEALQKIRSNRYALVVLNWNLAHQNGVGVLWTMRKNGLRIPVVVLSDQRREAIGRDLDSMAAGFVNKLEMNPAGFRNAIVASILLQEGVFGVVRSGYDTKLDA